jgi:hypothetical protein
MQAVSDKTLDAQRAHDIGSCQECHPPDGIDRPYALPLSWTEAEAAFRALGYWRGGKLSCIKRIKRKFGPQGRVAHLASEAELARQLLDRIEHQTGRFPRRGEDGTYARNGNQ